MRIARWAGFVMVLSLLLLTSLSAYAQQKGDFAGLVEIGDGRKMNLECRGSGSPTVILESGYRDSADNWSTPLEPGKNTVFPQVAKFTRVCAYDRPRLDRALTAKTGPQTALKMKRSAFSQSTERENEAVPLN